VIVLRLLRITVTTVIALAIIAVTLGCWFLFTTPGNREAAMLAQGVEPRLQIDISHGSLWDGVGVNRLVWQDDALQIQAKGIDSDWNIVCLLKRTFCAKRVHIAELLITTRSADASASPSSEREIALPAIRLPIAVNADHWVVEQLEINYADDQPPIRLSNIQLQGQARDDTLTLQRLSARYVDYAASLAGKVSLRDDYPLQLRVNALAESLVGDDSLTLDSTLSGSLTALRVDATTRGLAETRVRGTLNVLAPHLPVFATAEWQRSGWPLTAPTAVILENGRLAVQGDLRSLDTALQARISTAQLPPSDLQLKGELRPSGLTAEHLRLDTLDGHIAGTAEVTWSPKLRWQTQLAFEGLDPGQIAADFPGALGGELALTGNAGADTGWQLDVDALHVRGQLKGAPIDAEAAITHTADARWLIESLRVQSDDNRISVAGEIGKQADVHADIQLNALASLPFDTDGSLTGSLSLSGALETPDVHADLQSAFLRWQDLQIRGLSLHADAPRLAHDASRVRLSIDAFSQADTQFSTLSLNAEGQRDEHRITLSGKGPSDTAIDAQLSGVLLNNNDWQGYLDQGRITLPQHLWTLADRPALHWHAASNTVDIDAHCWRDQGSRLCLAKDVQAGVSGQAQLTLDNYALARLQAWLPQSTDLAGNAAVTLDAQWGQTLPGGFALKAQADLDTVVLSHTPNAAVDSQDAVSEEAFETNAITFPFERIVLDAQAVNDTLSATASLSSASLGDATLAIALNRHAKPLQISQGTLQTDGLDLSFLRAFVPRATAVGGVLAADLAVSGPVVSPDLRGHVTLSEPKFQMDTLPLQLSGGLLKVAVASQQGDISGRLDTGNGLLRVNGQADWRIPEAWLLDLSLSSNAIAFAQKPLVKSVVAPKINVAVRPGTVAITGDVDVLSANITVREIPADAVTLSSDVVLLDAQAAPESADTGWTINTTLNIDLGNAMRLSAYGLNADLRGDIRLVQRSGQPVELYGEILIPEGIYKSYGQDLTIEDGQILLIGPLEQSTLNIAAYREVDEVRAGLLITGSVETPVITLTSDPMLEQERILAYIVLGRDIAAGENNDGNILATAALAMGIKNGRGLATRIAESVGIRDFAVEASGRGEDTQLLLSGRLSSRLLVRYGVGVFTSVNTLYLRYDLTRKLYLETAQGLERAVDIFYSVAF